MDEIISAIEKHFGKEWATVTGAPLIFLFACAVIGVLIYWALDKHHSERTETLNATIGQKQSLIDEYKDRLNGATPLEVAKEIVDLKSTISTLNAKINRPQRKLTKEQKERLIDLTRERLGPSFSYVISTTPDTESNRYAKEIFKAFKDGGSIFQFSLGSHDEGESGLIIYAPDPVTDVNFNKLYDVLTEAGISFSRAVDEHNPDQCYIFVTPED